MNATTPPDSTPAISNTPIFKVYEDLEQFIMLHFYSYDKESAFDNASSLGTEKYLSAIQLPLPTNLIDNQQIIMSETEIGPLQEYLRTADLATLARSSFGALGIVGVGSALMTGQVVPLVAAAAGLAVTEGTIFANGGPSVSDLPPEYDILKGLSNGTNEGFNSLAGLGQSAAASFARNYSQRLTGITQNVGQIINPVLTPIFNNVQLKRHNFVWKIAPESPEESKQLKLICKRLQYHALPKKDNITFASGINGINVPLKTLRYPDYCRIELKPDVYSFKKNCFIENVIINHAPEGVNAFYKDGTPVVTEISVFLLETNIYTKDDFNADEISLQEKSTPQESKDVQVSSPTDLPPDIGS